MEDSRNVLSMNIKDLKNYFLEERLGMFENHGKKNIIFRKLWEIT